MFPDGAALRSYAAAVGVSRDSVEVPRRGSPPRFCTTVAASVRAPPQGEYPVMWYPALFLRCRHGDPGES